MVCCTRVYCTGVSHAHTACFLLCRFCVAGVATSEAGKVLVLLFDPHIAQDLKREQWESGDRPGAKWME